MGIRLFVPALLAFALAAGCWAQSASVEAKGPSGRMVSKEDAAEYLTRNVPVEYGKLTTALAAGKEKEIVDALLPVIEKAHARYENSLQQDQKDPALHESGPAYLYAWIAAVDTYAKLTGKAEHERVIAKWDELLAVDRNNAQLISSQIHALLIVWDKDFRTERFINTYQKSEDLAVVQVFNFFFSQRGGAEDIELLTAKQQQIDRWYERLKQQFFMAKQQIDVREQQK